MTKTLDTLVDDIYALLDGDCDHEPTEENVEAAGELLKEVLRSRFRSRQPKTGEAVLRFSSIGKKERQLWYEAHGFPREKMPPKTYLKFLYGDLLEILLLFLAKEAGHEVTHEQHEVTVDGVKGHMDAVIDGVPVDVKSASAFAFKKFENGSFVFDDPFGYVPQLSGYANALAEEEGCTTKAERAAFFVVDKVSGDLTLAPLDGIDIAANPPAPRIARLRDVIADPSPPSRCYPDEPEGKSGNRKLGVGCSYCDFKESCWSDANGGKGLRKFFYSRGPVWLTKVAKEPRVDES
jgi:CRISPR/Cas system-associated exonuclease Cas4 (RecB family)